MPCPTELLSKAASLSRYNLALRRASASAPKEFICFLSVAMSSCFASLWLPWAAGIFNGAVDGSMSDEDTTSAKDMAARIEIRPFDGGAGPLNGLGVGLAGTAGSQQNMAAPAYQSVGQLTFFTYEGATLPVGTRRRMSPHIFYYHGPVGAFAEYIRSSQDFSRGSQLARVKNDSWQVAGSIVLTGEAATASAVQPRAPFDPDNRTWGAFELAARYNVFRADDRAFASGLADAAHSARRVRSWEVGINWFLNPSVKYVLDAHRTTYEGGAATGNRQAENVLMLRLQLSY